MQAYVARLEPVSDRWHATVSAALFLAGCDFSCPNCDEPDCLLQKQEYLRDLKDIKLELSNHLGSIKGLLFSGGEPCLQRAAMMGLSSWAREKNLKVGIETNGSKPDCLRSLITMKLLDFVALDLKAPFSEESFEHATRSKTFFKPTAAVMSDIRDTLKLLKQNEDSLDIEVRLTITPTLLFKKEDVLAIAEEIADLRCTLVLQQYNPSNVKNAWFASLKSPSHEFLLTLKEAVLKSNPNMRLILDSRLF
jgi:pyruvate formate lyase activating enzyme